MKLSVIVPARNEAQNIGSTLDQLIERLTRERLPYEIVVVDDGSSDRTGDVAAARQARVVRNSGPHGFGYAVRCGLEAAQGDAMAIVMADGSDDPNDLITYYYILRDQAECAFGSRFMPASKVESYPRVKLFVNRLANNVIRALFGFEFNDTTNAFKAYRRNVIEGCRPLISPHFNLTVELPLKAITRGFSYEVVPISWRQRTHGESSLRLKEMGSRYLFIVLYVWLEKTLTRGDYRRRDLETLKP